MKFRGFFFAEGIGAPAGIDARVPQGFAGVDIADSGDAGLIQQELLERAPRSRQHGCETSACEFLGERIHPERAQTRAIRVRFEIVDAPEMAAIGKTDNAAV